MELYDFRAEYQKNPADISVKCPRFSWKMRSEERDVRQLSYRLQVSCGGREMWDSGVTRSDQSVLVPYGGKELLPETVYRVKVTVEDNYNHTEESELVFETGIFDPETFSADMITHDFEAEEKACPIFFRHFTVKKKVARAFAYATAQGVYELYINGRQAGDLRMAPGWTSYRNRLMYQKYNITGLLAGESEENTVEIAVGNGWYKGYLGFDEKPNHYGDRVGVFAELHIFYTDGSQEIVKTDTDWKVRTGQILESEIYFGETVDTTVENFREGTVCAVDFDKSVLCPQENEPVRVTERLKPVKIFTDPAGNRLVDFGQNMTGVVELTVKGEKGQKVVVSHAETLDRDGVFYTETLRTAKSVDTYILNGEEQVLRPHFTFHGFRYAKIEGLDEPGEEMFAGCVMHSDMEEIGSFCCSNEKVNRLQSNITWSFRDNFLDIPTDCPQRNERLGWTGDAQIFAWTAAFNRNTARFFSKWMRDVAADSSLDKGVPHVVPDILGSYSSSAWSDVAVIVPWVVYQIYGDVRILEESWQVMHEWVDYIKNHCGANGLWQSGFQYGDWLALDKEESADRTGATDRYMIANAYYIYVTDLVAKTAEILGRNEAAERYRSLRKETLSAFQREYYTETGRIVSETQTGAVISLYFDLARENDRERILQTLLANIESHRNHLTTGFVGTPYLCHVLSENGAHETAATLFMREDYPSWLYAVNKGATTMWERWNSIMPDGSFEASGMNSLNHYAYGSIGDWMYRKIAGISQLAPGYKRIRIRPMPVKGIEEARAVLESPYGRIGSGYTCRDGKIRIEAEIPANTTAEIYLPEKDEMIAAGSGHYVYEYDTSTSLKYERFTMDTTFGEILAEPLARRMFEQMVPGMLDQPMIEYAYPMTLTEMLGMAPEAKPMYEAVIRALNAQE